MQGGDREIELKLRFDDERVYKRLLSKLDPTAEIHPARQVNHFFETDDRRLRARRIGVRLREEQHGSEPPHWILTAKGPADGEPADPDAPRSDPSALSVRREEETTVDASIAKEILAGERSPLDVLGASDGPADRQRFAMAVLAATGGQPLKLVGEFENRRHRIAYDVVVNGETLELELELDRTVFPGGVVHHELEAELTSSSVADEVTAALESLVREAGGETFPSRGKASRFFDLVDAAD